MPEMTATERRHQRGRERRESRRARRCDAAAAAEAATVELAEASPDADAMRLAFLAARAGGLATFELGNVPGRAAPPALGLIRRGGKVVAVLDRANPTTVTGRARTDVTEALGLGATAGALLAAATGLARGRSHQSMEHMASAARRLAELMRRIGLDGVGAEALPADLFDRVESRMCADAGVEELTPSQGAQLNEAEAVVGSLPGAGHVVLAPRNGTRDYRYARVCAPTDRDVEKLLKRAMAEIREVMEAEAELLRHAAGFDEPVAPIVRAAALLRSYHPAGPPSCAAVRVAHPEIFRIAGKACWRQVLRLAYPVLRRLIPFAAVIGLHTRLNPSVMAELRTDAFGEDEVLDVPRLRLAAPERPGPVTEARLEGDPWKGRSRRGQFVSVPVAPDEDNPSTLLAFLEHYTAGFRGHEPQGLEGRVFVAARLRPEGGLTGFARAEGGSLNAEFGKLCERAGIAPFLFKALRVVSVDLVRQATGGNPAAIRAAGWWRSYETARRHYLPAPAKMRADEELLAARQVARRELETGVDFRGMPQGSDRGCATLGFICLDPYRGPFAVGKGELCRAIGHCPACRHARVDYGSPAACALLTALAERLRLKRDGLADIAWAQRWGPILARLMVIVAEFPDEVVEKAKAFPLFDFPDFS